MSIRRRREGGFTLIELSIAMAVFLGFMTLVTPFMFTQIKSALRTESQIDVQQGARATLRAMVRELRQASVLYSDATRPTDGERISFWVDFDGDATVDSGERFSYYVEGNVLKRGPSATGGVPLAEGVESMTFAMFGNNPAFDGNGDGVVTCTELDTTGDGQCWHVDELKFVTRVRVTLTVAPSEDEQDEQIYSAEAFLRNRLAG